MINEKSEPTKIEATSVSNEPGKRRPTGTDSTVLPFFQIVSDIVMREQTFYWQRFSAFAALHAGLLVLATSSALNSPVPVRVIGLVLGILWAYIQFVSRHYVNRLKPLYHEKREQLGIGYKRHWLFDHAFLSSTNMGCIVALGVSVLWIIQLLM